jgi:hypothetical protein
LLQLKVSVITCCHVPLQLDYAKRHLTHTITSLRRLAMLTAAVDDLEQVRTPLESGWGLSCAWVTSAAVWMPAESMRCGVTSAQLAECNRSCSQPAPWACM